MPPSGVDRTQWVVTGQDSHTYLLHPAALLTPYPPEPSSQPGLGLFTDHFISEKTEAHGR